MFYIITVDVLGCWMCLTSNCMPQLLFFHDGASSLEELLLRAKELGYQALALTDHNNLCGAMSFAQPHPLGWTCTALPARN